MKSNVFVLPFPWLVNKIRNTSPYDLSNIPLNQEVDVYASE